MTGIVGAIVEAWDELRIHKVRVLLALVGVAAAVTAITAVTAAVTMLGQAMAEDTDRMQGRDATLVAYPSGGASGNPIETDAVVDGVAQRYDISYHSVESYLNLEVDGVPASPMGNEWWAVDPDYATIMRLDLLDGRWFAESDRDLLAPVLVVNQPFVDAYAGGTALADRPSVTLLGGPTPVEATIVGLVTPRWEDEGPRAYVLFDHVARWVPEQARTDQYRFWVPTELGSDLAEVMTRDLASAGVPFSVEPPYDFGLGMDRALHYVVLGVGGFALLLGGLGLLNIALVTVRYRIREIGIRRSFGATSGRVFFGVLMESVVATVVAGLVGVVIAVAVVKNIPIERLLGSPLQDKPGFPFSAAMVGMACAVGVGALAGLIPAIYAVRVKVIDAIRY